MPDTRDRFLIKPGDVQVFRPGDAGHTGASSPGVAKGASDLSDPNPVDPEHVKSLMLANFPAAALGWVDDASWIGPVEVPQDRIDTGDEDSWAASRQPDAIKRFAKAIKAGTGHTHPVILVQSPGNPKAVVIDGHHRTLAYRKLGRPVKAYVGQVEQVTPEMLETHSYQQHEGGDPANKAAVPGLAPRSGMISLDIPDGVIAPLPGGLTDHHVTVVYLGPDVDDDALAHACERTRAAAAQAPGPLAAMLTGIGTFPPSGSSDGKVPVFIPARIPGAEQLRSALQDLSASEHKDWKPHVTLAYLDEGDPLPAPREPVAVTFTHLSAHRGDDVERFPLGAASKVAGEGNAQTLRDYWSGHGHGGPTHHAFEKEIAWGTPGDFDRCVALVTEHGKMTPDQAKGFCNLRHHEALGYWPAQHAEMERGKAFAAAAVKVGPKGYEHGWVFVGVPAPGAVVHHPRHGSGKVTGHEGGHVTVRFDRDGAQRSFGHRADGGEPRIEPSGPEPPRLTAAQRSRSARNAVTGPAAYDRITGPDLDEAAKAAVADYQQTGYRFVNRYLDRGQDMTLEGNAADRVRALDDALRGSRVTGPVTLARGIDEDAAPKVFGEPGSRVGSVLTDKRLISTSVKDSVARGLFGGDRGAVLYYHLDAGDPALPLNKALGARSDAPWEEEVLLPRGQQWKVAKDVPAGKARPREIHLWPA